MKQTYHIWYLESPFDFPNDIEQDYDDYERAYNTLCDLVHQYDDKPFKVVGCIDACGADGIDETMDYIENIND